MNFTVRKTFAAVLVFAVWFPGLSYSQATASKETAHATPLADSLVLIVDPSQSTVQWTLDSSLHTVHGTFHVKRGSLTIDRSTGQASGAIVVDATSGESGNDSRDHKMHKEVLESAKYSEVIFRPDHVEGKIQPQGNSTVQLHGVFTLHGADHEFTATTEAQLSSTQWKGTAAFTIPYVEWKLKDPSNFLLKAKPVVEIRIDLAGTTPPH
jgi:polyisoprenoid-binding protein YceI